MKITFASPSKNNARKEEKKGMAMAKLFALDTNTKQYYILCHFLRNEYVTRMKIEMMSLSSHIKIEMMSLSSHIKTSQLKVSSLSQLAIHLGPHET